jgi:hypothetical protein
VKNPDRSNYISPPTVAKGGAPGFSYRSSTSCCVSQFTKNDIAGVKVNCGASCCSMNFRDELALPVTILYDHGILDWSMENANAEEERKADTRDRDFQV